jgi:hypothetical protein
MQIRFEQNSLSQTAARSPAAANFVQTPVMMLVRIFICICSIGLTLYAVIEKQNELVELRLAIPVLTKEVKIIEEENTRLRYEIERFESPMHLMELARKPEFSHLKFPYNRDIIVLPKPPPLEELP